MKSKNPDSSPTENDHLFDLLVDGQLDEPRRRELLAGLDDRPGGWRRCALAFLEAQSWREAMDALTHPQAAAPRPAATRVAPSRRRPRKDVVSMLLGMAASFLLAVGVTSWMHDMHRAGRPMAGGPGTATVLASPEDGRALPKTIPAHDASDLGENVRLVNLTDQGPDGKPRTVRLPAVQRDRLDEDWLRNLPSAIPDEVTQSLQQAGHEVRPSRQLLPFRMKDGRRLVVPVDQLDVHYVNNPGYQ